MKPYLQKIMNQVREENPESLYEGIEGLEKIHQQLEYMNMIGEKTIEKVQEKYKEKYGKEYIFKSKKRQ